MFVNKHSFGFMIIILTTPHQYYCTLDAEKSCLGSHSYNRVKFTSNNILCKIWSLVLVMDNYCYITTNDFFIGVIHNASGALVGGTSSDNHLGGHGEGVDYEVPENIKTLHHLALQYVNQVRQQICSYLYVCCMYIPMYVHSWPNFHWAKILPNPIFSGINFSPIIWSRCHRLYVIINMGQKSSQDITHRGKRGGGGIWLYMILD